LKLALLLDFDGTVTERDIGDLVVNKFAIPDQRDAEGEYRRGEISLRELWAHEIGRLRSIDEPKMIEFARQEARIRPGLTELAGYCSNNNIPVEIASSGIRFYIDVVLEKAGLTGLPVASPDAAYDENGLGLLKFKDGLRDCANTAMCKCERVWARRRAGRRVVFVGDGASDYCAALQADHIVAREALARYCTRAGVPFSPFEDFHDVLGILIELAADAG